MNMAMFRAFTAVCSSPRTRGHPYPNHSLRSEASPPRTHGVITGGGRLRGVPSRRACGGHTEVAVGFRNQLRSVISDKAYLLILRVLRV
jgi:hypothetical protein